MDPKTPGRASNLRDLTSGKLAEVGKKADGQAAADGACMTVVPETCFGFEIETKDGVLAFAYHSFVKMHLSPIGAVLELELSDCRVKFRGKRLRYVMSAMRRSYDVTLRAVEEKYAQTLVDTEPVITEITVDLPNEAPAPPGAADEPPAEPR